MRRAVLSALLSLVVLCALALAALALYDWNRARDWIGRKVEQRTGRTLAIAGDLTVHPFSLEPQVRAEDVTFANADWGEDRPMFDAESVEFRFSLPQLLLHRRVVVTELALSGADVLLQREADGRRNWILKPPGQTDQGRSPDILQLGVEKSRLQVKDKVTDTDVVVAVQSAADQTFGTDIAARGRVRGVPLDVKGASGGLLRLMDEKTPFPVRVDGTLGDARMRVNGTFTGPVGNADLDSTMSISGSDLAPLGEVLRISLPHTKPYRLSGRLERRGTLWKFRQMSGKVGASDLGGDFNVETSGKRPVLTAALASKNLDLVDLGGFIGLKPGQSEPSHPPGKVLPNEPYNLEKLRRMDAHVTLAASRFQNDKAPLDNLDARLNLVDGVFKLEPIVFGVAGGKVASSLSLDARRPRIAASLATSFRKLHLEQLVRGTENIAAALGALDGNLALKGSGNSPAAMLGGANGRIDLYSGGGQVSNLALEFAGADLAEIVRFWVGGDQQVQLRCAVSSFFVEDGLARSEVFIVDTDDTIIGGKGQVNLRDETLDLTLTPLPKDFSPVAVRGPLHVRGSFAKPAVGLDKGALTRKLGASVLLGLLNPLAAVLPLIETGPGKDAPCADLLQAVEHTARGPSAKAPAADRRRSGGG